MARAQVLFVDDNPAFLRTMERVARERFDVVTAASGTEALNLIRGGRRFDAIICDLWMPGLDGQALYEEILQHARPQADRVIFTSGGGLPPKLQSFANARRTLPKPFSADDLFEAVDRVIERGLERP
ncbi:MAG: hypothetical protein NVS1B4_26210 [Gemmatimonadaceae bacterium]